MARQSTSAEQPLPVREVSRLIGAWVGRLGRVWVEGQVTQANRRGGTTYLTLRDPSAALSLRVAIPTPLVERLEPPLADGARVVVHARPILVPARGDLLLDAVAIRPVGVGELLARLERLRRLLATEGLFAAERKRPLPFLPGLVGLITGRSSAAERDVRENATRRWPAVRFRVAEVAVQGPAAATEVTEALRRLDRDVEVDVIVIARGGGSFEDLLPFGDEGLLRAVAACATPVVSAVGHEQDAPLLDLVADVRASTPTDAGRRIVPDVGEEGDRLAALLSRLRRTVTHRLDGERAALAGLSGRAVLAEPVAGIVAPRRRDVADLADRAHRAVAGALARAEVDLAHHRARVRALSPAATLQRGYAVVQRGDGHVVRSPTDVRAGDPLRVRLAEGDLAARVADPAPAG